MKAKILILTLAAFGIISCQTDTEDTQPARNTGTKTIEVSFTVNQSELTRTGILPDGSDAYKCVWVDGDALGVYVITDNEETTTKNAKFTVSAINSVTGEATFMGYIKVPEGSGEVPCDIYYYHPYYAKAGQHTDLKLAIPSEQYPGEAGIDPKSNIMMGKPLEGKLTETGITSDDLELMFMHKTTFLHFRFASCTATGVNAATEKVKYFRIEKGTGAFAGEGAWLNAETTYNTNNTNFSFSGYKNSKSVILAIPEDKQTTLDKFDAWLSVANFSATGSLNGFVEDKFNITIVTDAHTIKKVWIPVRMAEDRGVYFKAGEVNRVNLNITDTDVVTSVTEKPVDKFTEVTEVTADMSGDYFIAGTPDNGTTWYIAENKDDKGIVMVPTDLIFDKSLVYDAGNALINNKISVSKVFGETDKYLLRYYTNSMSMSSLIAAKQDVDGNKTYGLDLVWMEDNVTQRTSWSFSRSDGNWVIENQAVSALYGGGKYIRFYQQDEETHYLYGYESQSTASPYFNIYLFKKVN